MHTIHKKPFETKDFSFENVKNPKIIEIILNILNQARIDYLSSNNKKFWWRIIQILPESFNQKRTITMNYENIFNIINQRTEHKLDEWKDFVKILKELPYIKTIME